MSQPHQIDYNHLPEPRANNGAAVKQSVGLSERDFLTLAKVPPLHKVLPPAVMMPESGLVDFSKELGLSYPATMPNLLAGNVKLAAGETCAADAHAGATVMLVLSGGGMLASADESVELRPGDISFLPGNQQIKINAGDSGLSYFYVDDSPLANYLGWQVATTERTVFTHFPAELLKEKLDEYEAAGIDASGVFLSHAGLPGEKLATPHLFAHLNRLMPGARNTIHAHAAPALTYVIHGGNNCFSLLGEPLVNGEIENPARVDWVDGQLSITPPNLWHGHFNNGDEPILSLVIQPAGLYYNDRTMNFLFADKQ
ncbi:MAG: hypothetical protein DRQ52_06175 [Gammaproteobacteria bacterium]|nr:MAG: hypothetical protein DRQ52_06175 [Gammaproteobacteria bacterium]